MQQIKTVINGIQGKMGKAITAGLVSCPEIKIVGATEKTVKQETISLPDGVSVPFSSEVSFILDRTKPDVVIDFTSAESCLETARESARRKINLVIGTTGLSEANIAEIEKLTIDYNIGAIIASNFAIGAVVMIRLAGVASKFFDFAEIIELHHEQKADAPSGTALATAREMLKVRGKPFEYPETRKETIKGTRGGQESGVSIHSVRLPGYVASQEVIFGGLGQTLTIRHDTIGRECYVPGVRLAVREITKNKGLFIGLDSLLNQEEK